MNAKEFIDSLVAIKDHVQLICRHLQTNPSLEVYREAVKKVCGEDAMIQVKHEFLDAVCDYIRYGYDEGHITRKDLEHIHAIAAAVDYFRKDDQSNE